MGVKEGDKVSIEYEGKLEDGTVFDSSKTQGKPMELEIGKKLVLPGFEKALMEMEEGEEKEFKLPSAEAYGQYKEELKQKFPREQLPKEHEPKVGMVLMVKTQEGQQFPAKIVEVTDKEIALDMNHPLAGKDLTFKVKVVSITAA